MLHKTGVEGKVGPQIGTALFLRNLHTVQLIGLKPDQRMITDRVGLVLGHNFAVTAVDIQHFNSPVRVKPVSFRIFALIIHKQTGAQLLRRRIVPVHERLLYESILASSISYKQAGPSRSLPAVLM